MRKRICVFLLSLAAITAVFAQQTDAKKINSIKRDDQYIYAEATMNTEEEAYQVAEELLATYINEYILSKKKLNKAERVIVKDIASKCEKIRMMRGEMSRVFVYVKKSDLIPADNALTLVKTEVQEKDTVCEAPPAVVEDVPAEGFTADDLPEEDLPVEIIARNENLRLNVSWQQAVVDELLGTSFLTGAKALLNRLRAEYKVKRYGSYNECKNPAACFWVIAGQDGYVQTVLGPGTERRTNFKTLQYDSLQNYSGSDAIWFTLSN